METDPGGFEHAGGTRFAGSAWGTAECLVLRQDAPAVPLAHSGIQTGRWVWGDRAAHPLLFFVLLQRPIANSLSSRDKTQYLKVENSVNHHFPHVAPSETENPRLKSNRMNACASLPPPGLVLTCLPFHLQSPSAAVWGPRGCGMRPTAWTSK